MTVSELIKKLQEYPPDMEVECVGDFEGNEFESNELLFEPVSSVEMHNDHGNTVRIS